MEGSTLLLIKGGDMANGLVPPGYQAVLIGSAPTSEELETLAPMEEGAAEGSLMLAQLDLSGFPPGDTLAELNQQLVDRGIPPWPGYGYIVYADTEKPSVYLAWQKGMAWLPVILGMLATVVLPPLLGVGLFMLMPEALQQLLSSLMQMGMMVLMMVLMAMMMKHLMESPRTERIEEAKR